MVLPAPLAPIRRVRDPGGRERVMFCRPVVESGKVKVRLLTEMEGGISSVEAGAAGAAGAVLLLVMVSPYGCDESGGIEVGTFLLRF